MEHTSKNVTLHNLTGLSDEEFSLVVAGLKALAYQGTKFGRPAQEMKRPAWDLLDQIEPQIDEEDENGPDEDEDEDDD